MPEKPLRKAPSRDSGKQDAKPQLDLERLRRAVTPRDEPPAPPPVTAGPIERVVELAFNPSLEKIREVTVVDRLQGRLLPQLDVIKVAWDYVFEIAAYRQDADAYAAAYGKPKPEPPNLITEFIYRTAQWQKSVEGKNLERAIDLALAETETRADDIFDGGRDVWKE